MTAPDPQPRTPDAGAAVEWPPGALTNLAHAYSEWKAATKASDDLIPDEATPEAIRTMQVARERQHLAHRRFDAAAEKLLLRRTLDEIDSTLAPSPAEPDSPT